MEDCIPSALIDVAEFKLKYPEDYDDTSLEVLNYRYQSLFKLNLMTLI
jgi:hypothetical protein